MACTLPLTWAGGPGGLKVLETSLLREGGRAEIFILAEGVKLAGGGHVVLKYKLKLHNTSIFGITNLI